jgi:hypothetical protein
VLKNISFWHSKAKAFVGTKKAKPHNSEVVALKTLFWRSRDLLFQKFIIFETNPRCKQRDMLFL